MPARAAEGWSSPRRARPTWRRTRRCRPRRRRRSRSRRWLSSRSGMRTMRRAHTSVRSRRGCSRSRDRVAAAHTIAATPRELFASRFQAIGKSQSRLFSALFLRRSTLVMEMMMKTFSGTLIVVASLMLPFAASAQQGSTGANSVGSAFTSPGPSTGAGGGTGGGADAGASTQVQNAGPAGSTGGNNVGATLPAPSAGQSAAGTHPDRTHQ
jgi:hypothetical protein